MRRALHLLLFLGISLLIIAALVLAAVNFVSGGNLLDSAQVLLLRLQLQSRQGELTAPYSSNQDTVRFEILPGASAASIAADLAAATLISDARLFLDFARVEGLDRRFEASVYFLKQTQSIAQIAAALTDSSKSFISFRTVEGARIEELAASIDNNKLLGFSGGEFYAFVAIGAPLPAEFADWAGIPAGASLEGYMFPDTYQLPPDISAQQLRDLLLRSFRARVGEELWHAAQAQGLSIHQAVTLASIIEREAVWRDEHPLIASVYRNRLAINMLLEADPTVQYGLQGGRGSWWPQITRADYQRVESPYNTYRHAGLPPGPIASPGLSAIEAALQPAESEYFYFRAACDQSFRHNFARNFEEHLANGC